MGSINFGIYSLINDLDGGTNVLPLTINVENTMIGCVDAYNLIDMLPPKPLKFSPKIP